MRKGILKLTMALLLLIVSSYVSLEIMNSRTFMFFGALINRVKTGEKVVALTFDDGPSDKTDEILSTLNDLDVKATFFVTGSALERHPDFGRKIAESGHELGNHTYSHKRMVFRSLSFIRQEIENTDRLIEQTGYKGTILFRPPHGKKFLLLPYYLSRTGRKAILWDIEPDSYPDVSSSPDKIVDYVVSNVGPGSIILLHAMYRKASRNAIRGVVESLRREGFRFVTVSRLLEYQNE